MELGSLSLSFNSKVTFIIKVNDHEFVINGTGHPELTLTHSEDIVLRKSDFICPRTLAIQCDKASDSLPREIVTLLQDPKTKGTFVITVN